MDYLGLDYSPTLRACARVWADYLHGRCERGSQSQTCSDSRDSLPPAPPPASPLTHILCVNSGVATLPAKHTAAGAQPQTARLTITTTTTARAVQHLRHGQNPLFVSMFLSTDRLGRGIKKNKQTNSSGWSRHKTDRWLRLVFQLLPNRFHFASAQTCRLASAVSCASVGGRWSIRGTSCSQHTAASL